MEYEPLLAPRRAAVVGLLSFRSAGGRSAALRRQCRESPLLLGLLAGSIPVSSPGHTAGPGLLFCRVQTICRP